MRRVFLPGRRVVLRALGVVFIVGVAGACGSDDSADQSGPAGSWRLSEVGGGSASSEAVATINFAGVDTATVSGTTGCNSFQGPYGVDGESIEIGPLAATLALCVSDELNAQEAAYLAALEAAATWSVQDDVLSLADGDGSVVAVFDAYAPSVVGSWTVTGYNTGTEAVTSVILGSDITLQFGDDGTVAGSSGCNEYSGSFTIGDDAGDEADAIAIGPLASTRRACIEPDGVMDQEAQFLTALEAAASWQFVGDRLELRSDDGALQVSAAPAG